MLRYVERKTSYSDNGPAWIGHVSLSRSGQTVYFNGRALKRTHGAGIDGNHYDIETRDEYWISGVKKRGSNRHTYGSGNVMIEQTAVAEYLALTGTDSLDETRFVVTAPLPCTDTARLFRLENTSYQEKAG